MFRVNLGTEFKLALCLAIFYALPARIFTASIIAVSFGLLGQLSQLWPRSLCTVLVAQWSQVGECSTPCEVEAFSAMAGCSRQRAVKISKLRTRTTRNSIPTSGRHQLQATSWQAWLDEASANRSLAFELLQLQAPSET